MNNPTIAFGTGNAARKARALGLTRVESGEMVKDLVKEMVVTSPLAPLARAVYGWVSIAGRNASQTLEVMERVVRPYSNCIDIGCGQGDVLRELLRRASHGHHLAIEPDPARFARLKTRFPQVRLFNLAAGDEEGETTLQHVVSSPLVRLTPHCGIPREKVRELHVLTARLDDLIPADFAVRFIKLVAPGDELQAFRGALALIRRCHPFIVFAQSAVEGDGRGASPHEVYDLLTENGLAISLMEDWLKGHSPLARAAYSNQIRSRQNGYFLAHP